MRVLIVEDEKPIADDLRIVCRRLLREKAESIHIELTYANAMEYLSRRQIDVMLLDLNLSGRDGFELLRHAVSYAFQTIVVSANVDRALEAFEYGVLDFIPKPYNEARIKKALSRLQRSSLRPAPAVKYLSVRKHGTVFVVPVSEVTFIKGADVYAELHLRNGTKELHDKTLNELSRILPDHFFRVHKSYIVDINSVQRFVIHGGGRYTLELHSQEELPVARSKFGELKRRLDDL